MTDTTVRSPVIGIDLGTTFSLVSVMQDNKPVVIPNQLGESLTPSAVSVTDSGELVVGAPARARAVSAPERTVVTFKRDMGTDAVYRLAGHRLTPQDASALVLAVLKSDAEAYLGCPVTEAVITVPAYFGELQRQATKDAGAIAGLEVERIINEPTAAAMAYGLHDMGRELSAVVLDLGGGTLDVTIIEIIDGIIEIQSSAGDSRLGGEDFVEMMAHGLLPRIEALLGSPLPREPRIWAPYLEACEAAKKRLSDATETSIVLPAVPTHAGPVDLDLPIARTEIEEMWEKLLLRVRTPIVRALNDARLQPASMDEVLLVGGATRMPCVVKLVAQIFGRMPLRALPTDEAVAMGAAVQAALKQGNEAVDDLVVTDVAPFTLGTGVGQEYGRHRVSGVFSPIIERGTVIPASRVKRYVTAADFQTEVLIDIFQGEHSDCTKNTKIGEYLIKGLPKKPSGEVSVDVRFTYDLNGLLEVDMAVVGTDIKATLLVEEIPGRLTPKQIRLARKAMSRLKLHPRDALPNITALARADALYALITGPSREHLGELIATFRSVLESQDNEATTLWREHLVRVTAELS